MTRNPRHSRISRMLKIHVYPLKYQKTHNFGKFREIRLPFFDLNNEKWNPLNSQRITRKSLNPPPPVMNHAKFARFLKNPTNPCSPTVPQLFAANSAKFAHFARFRAIDAKLTHFALIPTNILVYFSDSRKTGFNTLLTRITRNS